MKIKALLGYIILSTALFATNVTDYINKSNCGQIIDKQVFQICYDYNLKSAKYVSYTLDGTLVNKENIKKRPSFYTEQNLKNIHRSHTRDYTSSGYDRGHLANDASFDYSASTQRKTYTMANIIPQAPTVNRKTWIKAEKLERKVAVGLGSATIVNGVIYDKNPKRIGQNQIAVPTAFWKMIFNDEKGYKKCFLYQNDLNAVATGDKLRNHQVDCLTFKYLNEQPRIKVATAMPINTTRKYITGSRGGCYYLNGSGNKKYVSHNYCY